MRLKYKVKYSFSGEIIIDADDISDIELNFNDKVGFSGDDLYENLDHQASIITIEKYEE
jgi:hypothetical protein